MNKDKPIEEGRSVGGKFTKGNQLQKRRKPISVEALEEALANEETKQGITLVRHAIRMAYEDNTILKHIIDKFIPNMSVAPNDIKPIQVIIERYYQAEQGKNDKIIDIKGEITK